jgi:arylsulfatase A-like enzyme
MSSTARDASSSATPHSRFSIRLNLSTFVVGFGLVGFATEAALLRTVSDNIFSLPGQLGWVGVAVLGWFWVTAAWCFVWVVGGMRALARRVPRFVAWGLWSALTVGLALGLLGYAASWGLYFRVGRFSNLEAIIFSVENARTGWFWEYLKEAESKYLWVLGAFFAASLLAIPLCLRLAVLVHNRQPVRAFPRVLTWGGFGVGLVAFNSLLLAVGVAERSDRRDRLVDAVKNSVNPAVTLGGSLLDLLLFEEPIEPCLATDQLHPVGEDYRLPAGRKPSVIIVAVESLRHDVVHQKHQGREVMPNLNALARGGVNCTRAYTQSTHSDYADVCIPSSLYPLRTRRHHFYRATDPWPKTRLYDVLKQAGHATAVISSQNESWGGMDRFLASPNLDLFYDAERSDCPETIVGQGDVGFTSALRNKELTRGKLTDQHTTDTAIAWITEQVGKEKEFCLCINFQSSHFPYNLPADRERPFQPCAIDFDASFLNYPKDKVDVVRNAYYNALHESDKHLGRVVAALRSLGRLEDTILVVVGENGEAFWENGTVTHGREPVEPTLRVACVLHAPKLLGPRVEDYPVELIDVVPTVFALSGLPKHANFQGIDFLAKDRVPAGERLLFAHVETGLAQSEVVILGGRWKLIVDRMHGGKAKLFDLAGDPGETTDLAQAKPELAGRLRDLIATWRRNQLAYYHFPQYYRNYYPPQPPRWRGPLP